MSPRSEELLEGAREALRGAELARDGSVNARAASSAYYAMLYAARAALSERDDYAKTHGGTWHLFHRHFVAGGDFDPDLFSQAHGSQEIRELSDYSAEAPSAGQAAQLVELAREFVAAVETMLGD